VEHPNILLSHFIDGYSVEIVGEGGVGKTQLCHQLAISAQLGENAGKVQQLDEFGR
jgi:RecA/RadA recombinase